MTRNSTLLAGCLISLFPLAPAIAQEDDETVNCVRVQRIDRTEVINDRTIVFHMRNGDIYVNNLDRQCHDLDRGRPFSYQARSGQLCNVDRINVLDNFGRGLTPGLSCGLGFFEPADADVVEMLKAQELSTEQPEITVTDIEVGEASDDETEDD